MKIAGTVQQGSQLILDAIWRKGFLTLSKKHTLFVTGKYDDILKRYFFIRYNSTPSIVGDANVTSQVQVLELKKQLGEDLLKASGLPAGEVETTLTYLDECYDQFMLQYLTGFDFHRTMRFLAIGIISMTLFVVLVVVVSIYSEGQ